MDASAVLSRARQDNLTVLVRLHADFILRHAKTALNSAVSTCRWVPWQKDAYQEVLFALGVAFQDGVDHVRSLRKIKQLWNWGLVSQDVNQPLTQSMNLIYKQLTKPGNYFFFYHYIQFKSVFKSLASYKIYSPSIHELHKYISGSCKLLRCGSTAAMGEKWGCESG